MLLEIQEEEGFLRDWLSGDFGLFVKDSAMVFEGERILVRELPSIVVGTEGDWLSGGVAGDYRRNSWSRESLSKWSVVALEMVCKVRNG